MNSKKILEDLYNQDFQLLTETGEQFEISEKGSLGLLAIGYKGLIAWRKKKNELKKQKKHN